ncbi:site-specific DNA-methyltransferase [uncultured Desulfobacter sp.]|uniref:site-specific DNA-methyltransferase n=2 Tax=Desulfobacter TaxID=2289 RepID=UPI00259BBA1E|nr:site-specific DNA-methyltransferase [uncultured Desulfobacter sp.]
MPSAEQLRSRLLKKLSELFQLDQPDLDFGFYRIMHAKAQEVQDFIGTDLLNIVTDAFGDADEARKAELQAAYDNTVREAKEEYGIAEPEKTPKAQKAKAALDAVKDTAGAEADVYDHLYRFFERYYDDGDFISRRYYTRETSGKAAPFAVPYNGEEVKLHWANADQYYIKSAEYFSNFTFDLRQAQEIRAAAGSLFEPQMDTDEHRSLKVHFKVLEATEGEHGNVKASEQNKRFFIIHNDRPVEFNEAGELICNFEYRPDPEKTGQEGSWRDKRNAEAVETILDALENHRWTQIDTDGKQEKNIRVNLCESVVQEYLRLFKIPAPTDKDKKRPVLAKYVNQYTARNTMDYFIHKDLGGFLSRELDFYIKNEVMRLDDIENAEAPAVESYLAKIKVLRKIAGKLIDFLAQLEDFQKKLWLKKKFIIETNYCITLDRICNEQSAMNNEQKWLLQQVVENKAQWVEWQKLGFVQLTINNEQLTEKAVLETDDFTIIFNGEKPEDGLFAKEPLTYRKLIDDCSLIIDHWNLVLDTRFFDDSFKARLVASIENFDEQCDGLLIHSENFQALNLLNGRYRDGIKCVYFDPPYNTGDDGFVYKDSYQSSSWSSMMNQVVQNLYGFLQEDGSLFANCDENEFLNFGHILQSVFDKKNHVETITWNKRVPKNDKGIGNIHEYIYLFAKNQKVRRSNDRGFVMRKDALEEIYEIVKKEKSKGSDLVTAQKALKKFYKKQGFDRGITLYCELDPNFEIFGKINMSWPNAKTEGPRYEVINPATGKLAPIPDRGWRWKEETFRKAEQDGPTFKLPDGSMVKGRIWYSPKENIQPSSITYLKEVESFLLRSIISLKSDGSIQLENLGLGGLIDYPKPVKLSEWIFYSIEEKSGYFLDCFAGSGTAAHGLLSLNREYPGDRKYILVEMGDHFDTVLKPRIAKVVYSDSWKDGKPTARGTGVSHCFKYIRLESYEGTLNNLRLDHNPQRKKAVAVNPALKEDYMLRYLLDVETRGSQSLLNIDAFADPTGYTLEVKKPGTDEYATRAIDLIETFNYLIGLRVLHTSVPQTFQATFKRITDPELPEDQHTKLVVDGRIRRVNEQSTMSNEQNDNCSLSTDHCTWWFRKVEGWVPKDAANPNNGQREKVLVVWRKLTDDIEQDNLMLDEWFQKNRISTRDFEFDTIYVNGSNNLPNLKADDENWKVRLIEEEFVKRMWEVQQ